MVKLIVFVAVLVALLCAASWGTLVSPSSASWGTLAPTSASWGT
jgi:hypothetical protein